MLGSFLAWIGAQIYEKIYIADDPSSGVQQQGGKFAFFGFLPTPPARHVRLHFRGDGRPVVLDGDTQQEKEIAFLQDGIGGNVALHADTHASGGTDPVSPASIGAAEANHSHTRPISFGWYDDAVTVGNSRGPIHELSSHIAPNGMDLHSLIFNAKPDNPHTITISFDIQKASSMSGPWTSILNSPASLSVGVQRGSSSNFSGSATVGAGEFLRLNVTAGDGYGLLVTLIGDV